MTAFLAIMALWVLVSGSCTPWPLIAAETFAAHVRGPEYVFQAIVGRPPTGTPSPPGSTSWGCCSRPLLLSLFIRAYKNKRFPLEQMG